MRFTDNSRFSAFANINNINDNRKPGRGGDWQSQSATTGKIRTIKGGIDLLVADKYNKWRFNTANEITTTRQNLSQQQTSTTFLPQNNSTSKNIYQQRNTTTRLTSKNDLDLDLWRPKNSLTSPVSNRLNWDLSYRASENNSFFSQIEHNLSPDSVDITFRDLKHGYIETSRWYSLLLNTNSNLSSQHVYAFDSKVELFTTIGKNFSKKTTVVLSYDYHHQNATNYTKRDIRYPSNPYQSSLAYHRYTHTPLTSYTLKGNVYYPLRTKYVVWMPSAKYEHSYNSSDHSLFNLNDLEGWGIDSDRALRSLPSTRDSLQICKDAVNSYYSRTYEDKYTIRMEPQHSRIKLNEQLVLVYDISLPLDIIHTRLRYQRNTLDASETRTKILFNPHGSINLRQEMENGNRPQNQYRFTFGKNTTLPSLVYRLNITDTSDPLNTTLGNAHLKNPTSYNLGLSFSRYNMPHYASVSTNLNYALVRHALAQGFLYDTATGIRTTRPDNVNGNWNINGKTDLSRSFLKNDVLSFESHTSYGYLHSVDLTGTTRIERSIVHNVYTNEEISMKYKFGKNNIGFKGKLNWTNLSSKRDNFQTQNLWDFNYGLTALLNLPWELQFSTDITMFSHRGYDEHLMNRNDIVWNARLTRVFFNGKLTCFIDGFDILGQLSNIQRYVNAQGRTETRYNVQPRYAMIHFIYRFAKQPKEKQ